MLSICYLEEFDALTFKNNSSLILLPIFSPKILFFLNQDVGFAGNWALGFFLFLFYSIYLVHSAPSTPHSICFLKIKSCIYFLLLLKL